MAGDDVGSFLGRQPGEERIGRRRILGVGELGEFLAVDAGDVVVAGAHRRELGDVVVDALLQAVGRLGAVVHPHADHLVAVRAGLEHGVGRVVPVHGEHLFGGAAAAGLEQFGHTS